MRKTYVVKQEDDKMYYDEAMMITNPSSMKIIDHEIRIKILRLLSEEPMYPAQLAKKLKMHEQKVYYHVKQLLNADILEITERQEIRGTVAKKFRPKNMNFALCLKANWKNISGLESKRTDKKLESFLDPFVYNDSLNAKIIVGSPDPHGPFKARARDGHYAIDLALFLGKYAEPGKNFSVKLDTDIDLKEEKSNLIIVGGPVTNLLMAKINDFLPAKFSEKKPWGIKTARDNYTDDAIGFVARIPNPYNPEYKIIAIAGIRHTGTKGAVIGITRNWKKMLETFSGQKAWAGLVHGYDLDGDGKIDSVEVVE